MLVQAQWWSNLSAVIMSSNIGLLGHAYLPQLQFVREHTCFSGFSNGFVVLLVILTAPLTLMAAFACSTGAAVS